ncbi:tetratricopeptide repeat protein [Thalassotalea crassostreae]|uniref:tetratricopeptide repeat protein n=1 Tax=Thalassotalea crassostreae TaxID=1763536 RepID=UPI000838E0B2|nr:hypothetical protein [Thalassotalea crassostreae]
MSRSFNSSKSPFADSVNWASEMRLSRISRSLRAAGISMAFAISGASVVLTANAYSAEAEQAPLSKTAVEQTEVKTTKLKTGKGVAIYNYLQDDYFQSLTELVLLEKQGVALDDKSKLLKAGLELHFEMDNGAGQIFAEQLLDSAKTSTDPAYKDFVFFRFAKALYKKQQYNKANKAINQVGENLAAEYVDEFYYYSAQIALRIDDLPAARAAAANISEGSIYHRYLAFNVAMELLQQSEKQKAIDALAVVVTLPGDNSLPAGEGESEADADSQNVSTQPVEITDEIEALIDRANLAKGYLHIQLDQNDEAIECFKRISADSLDTESAYLGYGWAMANKGDFDTALAVWQKLGAMPSNSTFVLEANIAQGYAHEQLDDTDSAYAVYSKMVDRFQRQQTSLDDEIAKLASDEYLMSLLAVEEAPVVYDDNGEVIQAPQNLKGGKVTFNVPKDFNSYDVVASNEFQHNLEDINDLNVMHNTLILLQQKSDELAKSFYQQDLNDKAAVTAATVKSPIEKQQEIELRQAQINELERQYRALDSQLNQTAFGYVGKLFTSDPVIGNRNELTSVYQQYIALKARVDATGTGPEQTALKLRLDRIAGSLLWQIGDHYLDQEGRTLKQANINSLAKLQENRTLGLSPVFDMQTRLSEKMATTRGLQKQLLMQMQEQLIAGLNEQRSDLSDYMQKAKMAIVRITDDAFIKQQGGEE